MLLTPVFCSGAFPGQRSLEGYRDHMGSLGSMGSQKSQMQLSDYHFHFHVMTGECFYSSYSAWPG